jgi:hypothetical protein
MRLNIKIKIPNVKDIEAKLRRLHSAEFVHQINADVVENQIKRLIKAGTSPVDGYGRFVQYKDRTTYPNDIKSSTPVNLTLSGQMLSYYKAFVRSVGGSLFIGIVSDAPTEVKDRARGNNLGTAGLKNLSLNKDRRARLKNRALQRSIGRKVQNLNQYVKDKAGIPQRRFIPQDGEKFTISVMAKLKNLYAKRIKDLLSKG